MQPQDSLIAGVPTPLEIYLHVPFCARRCGYCDFNTYTAAELGGTTGLGNQDTFADSAILEIEMASDLLAARGRLRPASTVFFGGGTPTLLPATDLARLLDAVRGRIGLIDGAEVTTEANPDSVDESYLQTLAEAGFTRVSIGMQSTVSHVLAALDRTHDPSRVADAVAAARRVGLQVSLDLIYGAHGESLDDWRRSLQTAIALAPDHVSAYALVVEDGTPLARRVARGELDPPQDDDLAAKYELADELLGAAGYDWYEVSNWAKRPSGAGDQNHACQHNIGYWSGADWWGIGPGAHSHIAGQRWWNVKHPRRYATMLADGEQPVEDGETLDDDARYTEQVLLGVRLASGLALDELRDQTPVAGLIADGLIDGVAAVRDRRLVLTRRGRLLADGVVRTLLT